ncbi:6-phosphofructokinase, pyrophosphate-dependent [Stigmatella aurantiaca DW4/3-1]|uniref:Pyrophosphate--fructose 6-phosphate 1-phosphotransferase n=2 Tax=Stigmatella aurantiaca TaxID=41 RepID=Q08ST9_STIAD|nr:6-phosphofructokinase, pyrophosphate-dependent [Stigmatella aurantiaca DW4/3-1]EAU63538.1 6-phosphofructokinase, pyrophosphate-dependent [Stigmatella aurantiaca DW4/3-1]
MPYLYKHCYICQTPSGLGGEILKIPQVFADSPPSSGQDAANPFEAGDMKKLAIVVAGGPAPGINSVIGAATIRACLSGVEVLGIQDGFKWLSEGDISRVVPLTIADTSRIHFRGGSHIGISRANPTRSPEHLQRTIDAMERLGVGMLITIGGDGTATLAQIISEKTRGKIRVVHVPKTIDNDIDLPHDTSTFGFQTARHVGVDIVKNLMVDAKTTSRWYFVVAQGRKAGHLALSIGKAVGATVTLIPEEFRGKKVPFATVVDILTGSVLKRLAYGRPDGIALLAEGLADCIIPEDLAKYTELPRDHMGNLHVADIQLGEVLEKGVKERLAGLGLKATLIPKYIGYEVRCADPIPFDMEYTRDLGHCAARYIIQGGTEAVVAIINGQFQPLSFQTMKNPDTGMPRVRLVDVDSDRYQIARGFMLRLKREDFNKPEELARLATTTHLTPEAFRDQFFHLVKDEPEVTPDAGLKLMTQQ